MAEGNFLDAQKKFLEALNAISEVELDPTLFLARKEAYALQLLNAIQAERKATEAAEDPTERKPASEPKK